VEQQQGHTFGQFILWSLEQTWPIWSVLCGFGLLYGFVCVLDKRRKKLAAIAKCEATNERIAKKARANINEVLNDPNAVTTEIIRALIIQAIRMGVNFWTLEANTCDGYGYNGISSDVLKFVCGPIRLKTTKVYSRVLHEIITALQVFVNEEDITSLVLDQDTEQEGNRLYKEKIEQIKLEKLEKIIKPKEEIKEALPLPTQTNGPAYEALKGWDDMELPKLKTPEQTAQEILATLPPPIKFQSYDEVAAVAANNGFPARFPDWKWGTDYEVLERKPKPPTLKPTGDWKPAFDIPEEAIKEAYRQHLLVNEELKKRCQSTNDKPMPMLLLSPVMGYEEFRAIITKSEK
jgi:hypothetical protein